MHRLVHIQLLVFFCLLTFGAATAQECSKEQDPFTNEEVISFNFKSETIVFERKQSVSSIKVKFNLDGEINIAIKKGSPLLLKTEKGKIINMVIDEDALPVSQVSGTRVISVVVFRCLLSEEMLNHLSESRVVLIRHPDGKGSQYDLEIGKAIGKGFQQGADCLLNSK